MSLCSPEGLVCCEQRPVSALVAVAAVIATPRNYGSGLRSLLQDAEALPETQADAADLAIGGTLVVLTPWLAPVVALAAIGLLLLSVLLILPHNL